MRNPMLLASLAMTLLGACVGGIDTNGGDDGGPAPPGETPRQLFDRTVLPLLNNCVSCHVGPETSATDMFLGPDGLSSAYDTLIKDRAVNGGFNPDAATILLKGKHDGPAWSTSQAQKIATWLRAELAARGPVDPGGQSGGGITSAIAASMAFVSCMSVSLTEYNDGQAWQVANMNTNRGRCSSCHSPGGAGGQWLGTDNNYKSMFLKWQEEVFFTGVFQAQLQTDNTYKIAAAQTKICNKGTEKANNLGDHPVFDCTQNSSLGLNNLKTFAQKVQAKVDAKDPSCPQPAGFAPPTP